MASWPAHGSSPWDDTLKPYIDDADAAAQAAAIAAAGTYTDDELAAAVTGANAYADGVASSAEANANAYTDAAVAAGGSVDSNEEATALALRPFHVALPTINTAAVDVLIGPSDSIGEGAYAGSWMGAWARVLQDRLRRAVQPLGIKGGMGYMGAGSPLFLTGQPWSGVTGTVVTDYTKGLGLKSFTLSAGATLTAGPGLNVSRVDIFYRKVSGGGTFTVSVDGGAASAAQDTNGSGLGVYSTADLSTSATHSIVITAAGGPVTITGGFFYNGDTVGGLRVWEAGHSGYAASNYISARGWEDDLANIPNPKLVILPIGSNDYYNGRSTAATKADIETLITRIRAKIGNPSIALVSYYDRPAPSATTSWDAYVAMYKQIADADDLVMHIDLGATFGPLESDTDSRGGLTVASPGDYVHPTASGHRVLAEKVASMLIPSGSGAAGIDARVTPTDVKAAEGDGQTYLDIGTYAGALSFASVGVLNLKVTMNGTVTLSSGSMPAVAAGRTASFNIKFTQDATGGRVFTMAGINYVGGYAPLIDTRPNQSSIIRFYYDGSAWWAQPVHIYDTLQMYSATQTGSSASISGVMTFASFPPVNGYTYRATLVGNASLATSGMPPTIANRSSRFRVKFTQDATGSRTLTLSGFLYNGGVAPVISSAATKSSIIEFFYDGSAWWAILVAAE